MFPPPEQLHIMCSPWFTSASTEGEIRRIPWEHNGSRNVAFLESRHEWHLSACLHAHPLVTSSGGRNTRLSLLVSIKTPEGIVLGWHGGGKWLWENEFLKEGVRGWIVWLADLICPYAQPWTTHAFTSHSNLLIKDRSNHFLLLSRAFSGIIWWLGHHALHWVNFPPRPLIRISCFAIIAASARCCCLFAKSQKNYKWIDIGGITNQNTCLQLNF